MAGELHHEVAGETVWALDNDGPRSIAQKPLQHFHKAGPVGHGVCATHRRIIERVDDLQPRQLGVGVDAGELALVAVLVGPDVRLALPVLETRLYDREAFRAIFSFGGSVAGLADKGVSNSKAAVRNAEDFGAEIVAELRGRKREAA